MGSSPSNELCQDFRIWSLKTIIFAQFKSHSCQLLFCVFNLCLLLVCLKCASFLVGKAPMTSNINFKAQQGHVTPTSQSFNAHNVVRSEPIKRWRRNPGSIFDYDPSEYETDTEYEEGKPSRHVQQSTLFWYRTWSIHDQKKGGAHESSFFSVFNLWHQNQIRSICNKRYHSYNSECVCVFTKSVIFRKKTQACQSTRLSNKFCV